MTSNLAVRTVLTVLTGSLFVAIAAAAQAQQQRAAAVEVTHAEVRQLAPSVRATGVVQSRAAADLAAAVAGRLEWVADPGTFVEANAVVARIDVTDQRLARAEQSAR